MKGLKYDCKNYLKSIKKFSTLNSLTPKNINNYFVVATNNTYYNNKLNFTTKRFFISKQKSIPEIKEVVKNSYENIENIETKITDNSKFKDGFCSNINEISKNDMSKINENETINSIFQNEPINSNALSNRKAIIKDLQEITKLKLSALNSIVSLSTYVLFIGDPNLFYLANFTLGTLSISMTTQVLNQIKERIFDGEMKRTHNRPMPKRKFTSKQAFALASLLYTSSLFFYSQLPFGISAILLSNLILFLYIQVYTPLKRVNNLSMHVGALVGALPALLGSVAAINSFPYESILLAGYILCWQYPHFYGILYPNRADYKKAGFKFISVDETKDNIAYNQIVVAMIVMFGIVYEMKRRGIIGEAAFWMFTLSYLYKIPAIYKFTSNPVKYGKIIRIRSYTPFLIILGSYISSAVSKRA